MLSRQSTAGPSYKACVQAFVRSVSTSAHCGAPYGVKESSKPFGLHLGARKKQLQDAVQSGKAAPVENDVFKKLLDSEPERLGQRAGANGLDPITERRARSLGRRPSVKKLQSVFGDSLPKRPTRTLKYPSQIKKFIASRLEGDSLPSPPRLLPREVTDPYYTADKFKRFVSQHRTAGVLGVQKMQEAINIVRNAAPQAQNVVVWNQCLVVVGQEGMLDRQFKLYNDMKRAGIKPSTRTFTILLSSYARASPTTKLERRAMSRATLIFDNAVKHLRELVQQPSNAGADTGLEANGLAEEGDYEVPGRHRRFVPPDEASVAPYNAYLSFCQQQGLWAEIQRVFLSLDRTGLLSPDSATYTIMLKAVAAAPAPAPGQEHTTLTITARSLWDQAVRQFRQPDQSILAKAQHARRIDSILANQAIASLVKGRWEDQKYAMDIIPKLYNLSLPGQSSSTPQPPPSLAIASLPVLPLDVKTATSILRLVGGAKRHDLASHYVHLFLANPEVMKEADLAFFLISITSLSENRDVDGIMEILESYQPPSTGQDGWPLSAWHSMLNATRWAKDWRSALVMFRKMTKLPSGVEHRRKDRLSRATTTIFQSKDARGIRWQDTSPLQPDAESMSLLLKTGLQSSADVTLQALRVFAYFPSIYWTKLPGPDAEERKQYRRLREDLQNDAARAGKLINYDELPREPRLSLLKDHVTDIDKITIGQRKALQWTLVLFEDVERAIDRVVEQCKIDEVEREELSELRGDIATLLLKWESLNTSDGIRYIS